MRGFFVYGRKLGALSPAQRLQRLHDLLRPFRDLFVAQGAVIRLEGCAQQQGILSWRNRSLLLRLGIGAEEFYGLNYSQLGDLQFFYRLA